MVTVLHIVPVQPADGIKAYAGAVRLPDGALSGAFIGPYLAALPVTPEQKQLRHLVAGPLRVVHVLVNAVWLNGIPFRNAVFPCPELCLTDNALPGNEYPWLALHLPVVGISETDPGVFDDLCADAALCLLPGLHVRVPPGIQTAISVNSGVPGVFPQKRRYVVSLGERFKFLVDNTGRFNQLVCIRRSRQRSRRHLHVVRGDGSHDKAHHPLEEVELWRGQTVALHALPLLADVEILVHLYRVGKVNRRVEALAVLVQLPGGFHIRPVFPIEKSKFIFRHSSLRLFPAALLIP